MNFLDFVLEQMFSMGDNNSTSLVEFTIRPPDMDLCPGFFLRMTDGE